MRDTYRSRQRGNFCPGLPFPKRFLSPPKRRRLPSEAQRRPCPKPGSASLPSLQRVRGDKLQLRRAFPIQEQEIEGEEHELISPPLVHNR